jgi:hypothetical protein
VSDMFIVFINRLDMPRRLTAYRGDHGSVVVYDNRAEAEAVAAELTAANKNPNISFTVTELERPRDRNAW